jgi:VanZ family protein
MPPHCLDETSSRSRWFARGSVIALTAYWLLLITATHIPKVPEPFGVRPSDKLLHLSAYAVLGALVGLAFSQYRRLRLSLAAALLAGVALHGMLDEVTQPLFGRDAEVADWFADVAGAVLGLGLMLAISMLVRRRADSSRT